MQIWVDNTEIPVSNCAVCCNTGFPSRVSVIGPISPQAGVYTWETFWVFCSLDCFCLHNSALTHPRRPALPQIGAAWQQYPSTQHTHTLTYKGGASRQRASFHCRYVKALNCVSALLFGLVIFYMQIWPSVGLTGEAESPKVFTRDSLFGGPVMKSSKGPFQGLRDRDLP